MAKKDSSTQKTKVSDLEKVQLITEAGEWPGAFGAFKYSSRAILTNLATVIYLIAISLFTSIILTPLQKKVVLFNGLTYIISGILAVASYIVYLNGSKGKRIELADALKKTFSLPLLFNMLLLSILSGFVIVLGFLLFIIPGLIILPRLTLAPYFLIDQKLTFLDAFKASWNSTKGHSGKIWGVIGATIVMILPAFTIIGIPLTIYLLFMYAAITAVLYEYIKQTGPKLQ